MAWLLTWLVQGLAIALIARVAFRALPGLSAATRYAMWWAALVLVLILPIVRGLTLGGGAGVGVGAGADAAVGAGASRAAASSASSSAAITSVDAGDAVASAPATGTPSAGVAAEITSRIPLLQSFSPGALRSLPSLPPISLPRVPDWLLSIAIGLWLGLAMVGLAQLAYSVQAVRQLKESCRRMIAPREADLPMWSAVREQGRTVRVRASDRVRTAAVLGLTRPIIAVPRDASEALTPHEIDQVVLHEYAHVQRYDDWTKLLQVLIAAFFGWHPAVRLMMREIDFEREAACDDYVVDVTGAPRAYARCLTKVIEMMPGPGLAAIPYASSSAHTATTRIERLLDRRRPDGRLAVMPATAGSITLAALAFCTVHALPIATDHPGSSPAFPRGASLASADRAVSGSGSEADARDARTDVTREANGTKDASDVADASGSKTGEARRLDLRIARASTLPIELPFSNFSPLSRLTDVRLRGSRQTTPPAAAMATAASALAPNTAGTPAPAATSASATSASTPARDASAIHVASAAPPHTTPAAALRHARDKRPDAIARQPVQPADDMPSAAPQHVETSFALGPVASAADSDAMPDPSESGHIGRAWENTLDATSKAMGIGARAVGTATKAATKTASEATRTATKTASDATRTATHKAAAGVKASGTKTVRAFGRVKRTIASMF